MSCQLVPYLPMCLSYISNKPAGADPGLSWRPPNRLSSLKQILGRLIQVLQRIFVSSSYFPVDLTGSLQCEFWFAQFGLLLSVSQAGQANCCLLQLHPWGGCVSQFTPFLPACTRLDSAHWVFTYTLLVLKLWLRYPQESL